MSIPSCSAYHARSASGLRARKKTPPIPWTASATDALSRTAHELGEDVAMRAELHLTFVLTLGRIRRRDGEERRSADLARNGLHPLDQRLDARTRRNDLASLEVDQPAAEAVADRAPQVLLDQPVRQVRQRLALIDRAREPGAESVDQSCQRLGFREVRLRVADAHLDRRIRKMRTDAPPDLRVLVDRPGRIKEAHVLLVGGPAVEGIGHTAARKSLREDLGARRMQPRDAVFDERRARGERKQLGEHVAERIAHGDRPVRALDADVRMDAEAVVPPDDVLENLAVATVVRRVDDALLLPAAPGMRARAAETDSELVGQLPELHAASRDQFGRLREVCAPPCLHLDLRSDQLTDEVLVELGAAGACFQLLESIRELERVGIEQGELLLDRDREVFSFVERLASRVDLLVRGQLLRIPHVASVNEAIAGARSRSTSSSAPLPRGARRRPGQRGPLGSVQAPREAFGPGRPNRPSRSSRGAATRADSPPPGPLRPRRARSDGPRAAAIRQLPLPPPPFRRPPGRSTAQP